jgi:hypothetical protein
MRSTVTAHYTKAGRAHARAFPNTTEASCFLLGQSPAVLAEVTAIRIEILVVAERGEDHNGGAWARALDSALASRERARIPRARLDV